MSRLLQVEDRDPFEDWTREIGLAKAMEMDDSPEKKGQQSMLCAQHELLK